MLNHMVPSKRLEGLGHMGNRIVMATAAAFVIGTLAMPGYAATR